MITFKHKVLQESFDSLPLKDSFYTNEFTYSDGVEVYHLHYYGVDTKGTTVHETFIYKVKTDRDSDFKRIN